MNFGCGCETAIDADGVVSFVKTCPTGKVNESHVYWLGVRAANEKPT